MGQIREMSTKRILTVTGNTLSKRGIHTHDRRDAMDDTATPTPNSHVGDLTRNFDGIWKWNLWVVIRFRQGCTRGGSPDGLSAVARTDTELAFSPPPRVSAI